MRTNTTVGAVLAAAALVTGTVYATSAAAGTADNNAPRTGDGGVTVTATVPARVFAVVNADGTKLRGKAVASTTTIGTGVYDVRFNRNISACAWTGTLGFGTFGGSTGAGMIAVSGRAGTNNGLFVQTFNGAAAPTSLPFSVVVVCS